MFYKKGKKKKPTASFITIAELNYYKMHCLSLSEKQKTTTKQQQQQQQQKSAASSC